MGTGPCATGLLPGLREAGLDQLRLHFLHGDDA